MGSQADLGLTMDESKELANYQRSLVILGPAGGAVMLCPGNQVGVPVEQRCAYAAKCPLLRAGKAPADKLCPIERSITEERFSSWSRTVGQDPEYLTEDARSTVSTLTYIDLQEQRCTNILSTGEAARLTQTNVTEAINFTTQDAEGAQTQTVLPLTWERVLHINAELLAQLQVQRRMILKDWRTNAFPAFRLGPSDRASYRAGPYRASISLNLGVLLWSPSLMHRWEWDEYVANATDVQIEQRAIRRSAAVVVPFLS